MTTKPIKDRTEHAFLIRLADPVDADSIARVINVAFRPAEGFFVDQDRIDVGEVLNYLDIGKFLVAESNGTLLGCVYVEMKSINNARPRDHAYFGLLAVDPERQQSGLGSVLMDAAENHCRELGFNFMDMQMVNLREDLLGFYQRRGYVETGTAPFPSDVKTKLPCHFIEMSKPLRNDK